MQTRRSSSNSDLAALAKGIGEMPSTRSSNTRPPRDSKHVSSRPPRPENQRLVAKPPTNPTNPGKNKQSTTPVSTSKREQSVRDNSHFLKGINFDEQTDWLALPSPPSKQKRSRRQSTSILQKKTTPLQDMTNNDSLSPRSTTTKDKKSSSSKTRKRRSLCHVPSPMEHDDIHKEPPTKKRSPEMNSTPVSVEPPRQPLQLDLGDSDDEDGNPQNAKKRNRRRQSILLPSESGMEEIAELVGTPKSASGQPREREAEGRATTLRTYVPTPGSNDNQSGAADANLVEMQKLVRTYCSLPDDNARSECVELIRSKTGYALSLQAPSDDSSNMETAGNQQDSFRSQRRELLARLGPAVERMEHQKQLQASLTEQSTGCTVEKARSGKYRYRNASGVKVPTEEYKARYLEMIAANKLEKTKEYQDLRRDLESSIHDAIEESDSQEALLQLHGSGGEWDGAEKVGVDVDPSEVEESTESDMELDFCEQDGTVTDVLSIPETSKIPAVPLRNSPSPPKQHDFVAINESREALEDSTEATKGQSKDHLNETEDLMLPFPDRDEESEDPEIARAESKLWLTIDTALEEYSREVLAIQARRQARTEPQELS